MLKLNLLAGLVVIALTAGFAFGLLLPGLKRLEGCRARVADETEKVQADLRRVGNVSDLCASLLELDEELRGFRTRLPADRRFGEFLNDLSETLKKCEISDYVVQPRPAQQVDEAKLSDSLEQAAGTRILPVSISFRGSFAQLFNFLDGMEALPRLSHVESMRLVNDGRRPGNIGVEIMLHTYYHPGLIARATIGAERD